MSVSRELVHSRRDEKQSRLQIVRRSRNDRIVCQCRCERVSYRVVIVGGRTLEFEYAARPFGDELVQQSRTYQRVQNNDIMRFVRYVDGFVADFRFVSIVDPVIAFKLNQVVF